MRGKVTVGVRGSRVVVFFPDGVGSPGTELEFAL